MSNPNTELIIKSRVWKKDNVELIDYLNSETINFIRKINTSGVLRKINKDVEFESGENIAKTEFDLVKIIKNNNGRYLIDCGIWPKDLSELVDKQGIFLVYRGLTIKDLNKIKKDRYYKLSQGDIIKIGRMYLKVLEIHLNKETPINKKLNKNILLHNSNSSNIIINQQQIIKGIYSPKWSNKKHSQILFNKNISLLTGRNKAQNNNDSIDIFSKRKIAPLFPRINSTNELFVLKKISHKNKKTKSSQDLGDLILGQKNNMQKTKPTCRICYGEDSCEENPLICPCICKGSMKYIHYQCLKNWLNAKIEEELSEDSTERNPDCITYNRKDISCELCKEKFPDYIIHNNIYYNILFYKPKFEEFIIFESMKSSIVKNRNYHVLSLDNKNFISIGRAGECELSFAELSVSRNHCLIHKEKGKLYLEDNTSKFGTLVLIQNKNMVINDFMTLKIQVNKTFVKFKLDIPFSFGWNCCGRQDTKERLDYQIQNKKSFDIVTCFVIKEDNSNLISEENKEDDNNVEIIDNKEKNTEFIDKENKNVLNDVNNNINNNSINDKSINNNNNINNNNINNNDNNIINNNINNNDNNNIIINNNKDKESLIDKSSNNDIENKNNINEDLISNNNDNNNDDNNKDNNNNDNDNLIEIKEKEKEIQIEKEKEKEKKLEKKDDIINIKLNNNKTNKDIINKNEISSMVNNLLTNHIKRMSIKKGKNDNMELPKFDDINLNNIKENFSMSLLKDKNFDFNKVKINTDKNSVNYNKTDSFTNIKKNNIIISLSPLDIFEHSSSEKCNVNSVNNNK